MSFPKTWLGYEYHRWARIPQHQIAGGRLNIGFWRPTTIGGIRYPNFWYRATNNPIRFYMEGSLIEGNDDGFIRKTQIYFSKYSHPAFEAEIYHFCPRAPKFKYSSLVSIFQFKNTGLIDGRSNYPSGNDFGEVMAFNPSDRDSWTESLTPSMGSWSADSGITLGTDTTDKYAGSASITFTLGDSNQHEAYFTFNEPISIEKYTTCVFAMKAENITTDLQVRIIYEDVNGNRVNASGRSIVFSSDTDWKVYGRVLCHPVDWGDFDKTQVKKIIVRLAENNTGSAGEVVKIDFLHFTRFTPDSFWAAHAPYYPFCEMYESEDSQIGSYSIEFWLHNKIDPWEVSWIGLSFNEDGEPEDLSHYNRMKFKIKVQSPTGSNLSLSIWLVDVNGNTYEVYREEGEDVNYDWKDVELNILGYSTEFDMTKVKGMAIGLHTDYGGYDGPIVKLDGIHFVSDTNFVFDVRLNDIDFGGENQCYYDASMDALVIKSLGDENWLDYVPNTTPPEYKELPWKPMLIVKGNVQSHDHYIDGTWGKDGFDEPQSKINDVYLRFKLNIPPDGSVITLCIFYAFGPRFNDGDESIVLDTLDTLLEYAEDPISLLEEEKQRYEDEFNSFPQIEVKGHPYCTELLHQALVTSNLYNVDPDYGTRADFLPPYSGLYHHIIDSSGKFVGVPKERVDAFERRAIEGYKNALKYNTNKWIYFLTWDNMPTGGYTADVHLHIYDRWVRFARGEIDIEYLKDSYQYLRDWVLTALEETYENGFLNGVKVEAAPEFSMWNAVVIEYHYPSEAGSFLYSSVNSYLTATHVYHVMAAMASLMGDWEMVDFCQERMDKLLQNLKEFYLDEYGVYAMAWGEKTGKCITAWNVSPTRVHPSVLIFFARGVDFLYDEKYFDSNSIFLMKAIQPLSLLGHEPSMDYHPDSPKDIQSVFEGLAYYDDRRDTTTTYCDGNQGLPLAAMLFGYFEPIKNLYDTYESWYEDLDNHRGISDEWHCAYDGKPINGWFVPRLIWSFREAAYLNLLYQKTDNGYSIRGCPSLEVTMRFPDGTIIDVTKEGDDSKDLVEVQVNGEKIYSFDPKRKYYWFHAKSGEKYNVKCVFGEFKNEPVLEYVDMLLKIKSCSYFSGYGVIQATFEGYPIKMKLRFHLPKTIFSDPYVVIDNGDLVEKIWDAETETLTVYFKPHSECTVAVYPNYASYYVLSGRAVYDVISTFLIYLALSSLKDLKEILGKSKE